MINYDFINSVLAKFEGKAFSRGYIPCKLGTYYGGDGPEKGEPFGASGITIATGVDLGQQTFEKLSAAGICLNTLSLLEPYLGLKKQAAEKKNKKAPLTITAEQVVEIDIAVHARYINETADMFGKERFEAAPKEVQAVAVSLHYQFGTPAKEASPGLGLAWKSMRSGDYKQAATYLSTPQWWSKDHQQYLPRRRQEAALLMEIA
jgi:GH24 family phage-related lysozyme (muramidase)